MSAEAERRFAHALPFGAQYQTDGSTRFRVWAPSSGGMSLSLDEGPPLPMRATGDGWYEAQAACPPMTRYRYVATPENGTAESLHVPDPASRFQPGDVHGPSAVVDPLAYAWKHPEWRGRPWHETVLYELHVGACGGYRGVMARLPALAVLGVTAIELMPIADFPGPRNWGYDGVLPFAPDAAYGSPDELKALIDAAHGHRMMVFLDVVYNHFGPDGNYLPVYAAPFFRDDVHTPWGAAIDFRRAEVREFFIHNALYWLMEYRFDGLRLDAVHAMVPQDWLTELAARVRAGVEPSRHVHLVLENEKNQARFLERDYAAQWNDDGHHVVHVALTGEQEGYYAAYPPLRAGGSSGEQLARWLSQGFVYQGEPMPHRGGEPRGEPSAHLPPTAFVHFLQNHDQIGNRAMGERLITLADTDGLRAAAALQLLCPQIPLLFMGEEWGCMRPFLFFTSHGPELADAVREGRRQEFSAFAAFADEAVRATIPDPNDLRTFEASIADPNEAGQAPHAQWYAYYRHLLHLRRQEIVPHLRGARAMGAEPLGPAAALAGWRMDHGRELIIAVNLGPEPLTLPAPAAMGRSRLLFETPSGAAQAFASGRLPARSCVVYGDAR